MDVVRQINRRCGCVRRMSYGCGRVGEAMKGR